MGCCISQSARKPTPAKVSKAKRAYSPTKITSSTPYPPIRHIIEPIIETAVTSTTDGEDDDAHTWSNDAVTSLVSSYDKDTDRVGEEDRHLQRTNNSIQEGRKSLSMRLATHPSKNIVLPLSGSLDSSDMKDLISVRRNSTAASIELFTVYAPYQMGASTFEVSSSSQQQKKVRANLRFDSDPLPIPV
jgi:hypothetical protein